jgi:hypothetical protein
VQPQWPGEEYEQVKKWLTRETVGAGVIRVSNMKKLYVYWVKHGFDQMTIPGKSAAPHLVDMGKALETHY